MDRPVWVRSLYWRIVLSFCTCIAAVLAIQTTVTVLWINSMPDPSRLTAFTHAVAADLSGALTANPNLDVQRYVDEHYTDTPASLFIVAPDGRAILSGPLRPSAAAIDGARKYYRRQPRPTAVPDSWMRAPFYTAPIIVSGNLTGGVGVVAPTSWKQLLGWKMAVLSGTLLIVGTAIAGLFIFNPMRRRLHDLDRAARHFGAGDFSVRAIEGGGDELASLAGSFNRMAIDLGVRDRQLKAADRTRRLLLADVSHELMTPLTAIRAYREVLAMSEFARDPETAHCLDVLGDEAHRLESLIGDLLDLARLEAGGDSLEQRDVSVENLFGRVAARHEPEAKRRAVALDIRVETGAELLYGDPFRLEQALQNLVANALRHSPPGGEIEIWAETRG
ncbi:MAG TPA: HAMP domain-containing sensor histidine kinase, partial [Vicinamibacterales bacterium]|nr:HAMP domain-containing sensor histidine kinase [Vicinamibacterales bacterium]